MPASQRLDADLVAPVPSAFHSILFDRPGLHADGREPPACLADLNLDQVLAAVTSTREEYALEPFFYATLPDAAAVRYRHAVLRDLERPAVAECVAAFAEQLRRMRGHLAQADKLYYRYEKDAWFVDAVDIYCGAVAALADRLGALDVDSTGLRAFRGYLATYVASAGFTGLAAETRALKDALADVRYCVHINASRVTVAAYNGEGDYSATVAETFAKFKEHGVDDRRVAFTTFADMNHVEARILERVARLYPQLFSSLREFCDRHRDYQDATVAAFDREAQFYLAYLQFIERFTDAGLAFCYAHVSDHSKETSVEDAFDLALATTLLPANTPVRNGFVLTGHERILIVTGANQGGKSTFARMVGQLHYLANLGLPVPARSARLFLPDRVFTHFEQEEDVAALTGKLEDELTRVHDIIQLATGDSLIILNETFKATTAGDALLLGTALLRRLDALGALGVYVTFIDELAALSDATVSMVATVAREDPTVRTYRLARRPPDGRAYATALAAKHGLSYDTLKERLAR